MGHPIMNKGGTANTFRPLGWEVFFMFLYKRKMVFYNK